MLLTDNPGSVTLRQKGPLLPVIVTGPAGLVRTVAMIDPGSSVSCVALPILQRIRAPQTGTTSVDTVTTDQPAGIYRARLTTDGGELLLDGPVLAAGLDGPEYVLIGRDVLARMRFTYDGDGGRWTLREGSGGWGGLLIGGILGGAALAWWISQDHHKTKRGR